MDDQLSAPNMLHDIPKRIRDSYGEALAPVFKETRSLVASRVRAHLERLSLRSDARLVESITDTLLPDVVTMVLRDQIDSLRSRGNARG